MSEMEKKKLRRPFGRWRGWNGEKVIMPFVRRSDLITSECIGAVVTNHTDRKAYIKFERDLNTYWSFELPPHSSFSWGGDHAYLDPPFYLVRQSGVTAQLRLRDKQGNIWEEWFGDWK